DSSTSTNTMSLSTPPAWICPSWRSCDAAEPGGGAAVTGPDIQVVSVADDPDRHRLPQRAVWFDGGEFQLVRSSDLVELVLRPGAHQGVTMTLELVVFADRSTRTSPTRYVTAARISLRPPTTRHSPLR